MNWRDDFDRWLADPVNFVRAFLIGLIVIVLVAFPVGVILSELGVL